MVYRPLTIILFLLIAPSALCDYQFELSVYKNDYRLDADVETRSTNIGESTVDHEATGIFISYYLQAVPTTNVPTALAAYLSRASSLTLQFSDQDSEYTTDIDKSVITDYHYKESNEHKLGYLAAHFVTANELIFTAGLAKGSGDGEFREAGETFELGVIDTFENQTGYDYDIDSYRVGFGSYVSDNATVVVEYSSRETEFNVATIENVTLDSIYVSYENAILHDRGTSTWVSLSAGRSKQKAANNYSNNTISALFSYFPNYTFQLGAGFTLDHSDEGGALTFDFITEKAFTETVTFGLTGSISIEDEEVVTDIDQSGTAHNIRVYSQLRF